MEELKKKMWQRKSVLSRHLNSLHRHVTERSVQDALEKSAKAKRVFEEIEDMSMKIQDSMSGDMLSQEEEWLAKTEMEYLVGVQESSAWLDSVGALPSSPSVPMAAGAQSSSLSAEFATLLSLPSLQVPYFSGDPTEYADFMDMFNQAVDSKLNDSGDKFTRLLSYLKGEAYALVRDFRSHENGYDKARACLKELYGTPKLQVDGVLRELRSMKSAGRPQELMRLALDVLHACTMLRETSPHLLMDQELIKHVANRCHARTAERWRSKALDIIDATGDGPTLQELGDFLEREAKRARNPDYGYDHWKRSSGTSSSGNKAPTSSSKPAAYAASGLTCVVCKRAHALRDCDQFQGMSRVQRGQVVYENRLCYSCLEPGHVLRMCMKGLQCSVPGCSNKHHTLVHRDRASTANVRKEQDGDLRDGLAPRKGADSPGDHNPASKKKPVVSCIIDGKATYLPIVPVLCNGYIAYGLLDTGSTNTFISESLVQRTGLSVRGEVREFNTVGQSGAASSGLCDFSLSSVNCLEQVQVQNAFIVPDLPTTMPAVPLDLNRHPHLADVPIHHVGHKGNVEVLIGMDQPELLRPLEIRTAEGSGVYAIRTKLGWVAQGSCIAEVSHRQTRTCSAVTVNTIRKPSSALDEQVKQLWHIEHEDDSKTAWSVEDNAVNELWDSNVHMKEGHYYLPIPFKESHNGFPSNKTQALKRLSATANKVRKNDVYQKYDEQIKEMIQNDEAEEVPSEMIQRQDKQIWYLPHFPVFSKAKPDKVRIVFDCAAEYQGVSFNSQCLQGPDLVNKLLFVLLRFRLHPVALMSDIKGMYMQVRVPEDQRDAMRFLWYDDEGRIQEYRLTWHLFGGRFCASSSTYALRQVIKDFEASEVARHALISCMYVDDLLKSFRCGKVAIALYRELKTLLRKGGFEIVKWVTNDEQVLEAIPEEDRAKEVKLICPDAQSKALGIKWDVRQDQFLYQYEPIVTENDKVTKRVLLRQVSSLYDPLGLVTPYIIPGRLFFQEAVKLDLAWDQEVPEELRIRWSTWLKSLEQLSSLRFPRCVLPGRQDEGACELHHFCDSSEKAYGVCTYLRSVSPQGQISVNLLHAKGRIAPVHAVSIPRLELCGAVLAVHFDQVIRRELQLDLLPSTFWTDSQIVLAYVMAQSRQFKVFVANRVARIHAVSDPGQWRYIPSGLNPADVITRGSHPRNEVVKEIWIQGPKFLQQPRSAWKHLEGREVQRHELEYKPSVQAAQVGEHPLQRLCDHYSDRRRILRALVWWRRLLYKLAGNVRKTTNPSQDVSIIQAEEIREAEEIMVRYQQSVHYKEEIRRLSRGDPVHRGSDIVKLDPVLEEGILRVGGRLRQSSLGYDARHPTIVPKSAYSRMILREAHQDTHMGVDWILTKVREKYWIPGARNELRRIRSQCVLCQKMFGKPLTQKMADLPASRCQVGGGCFKHVGCDLFGPFYCKQGRATVKRYGVIFTCFSVRAVHLELLSSLETDTFINGFIRFIARRGWCETVRSDNGTNLVGASVELRKAFIAVSRTAVIKRARDMGITWTFNPPHSSHQGGVWERQIRTIRRVLCTILQGNSYSDEVLHTTFCQVESIINSRPITVVTDDAGDVEPLTPNHLLVLRGINIVDWDKITLQQAYQKRWCLVQSLAGAFWKRWLREYLPLLQARSKWLETRPNVKVGDVVFLADEASPRGSFPLAKVLEVNQGRDGNVRSVRVKVRGTELVRPITKLIPLEANIEG